MEQINIAGELANDVSSASTENQSLPSPGANEIRSLNDLEMALASGGDGVVCW